VGEDLADGDLLLAVPRVLGDVVRHPVLDAEDAPFLEHVDDEGGDRLRGGVDAEGGVEPDQLLRRVLGIARPVAAGVADRPVEDHGPVAAHA
jgi:hypothetical protein